MLGEARYIAFAVAVSAVFAGAARSGDRGAARLALVLISNWCLSWAAVLGLKAMAPYGFVCIDATSALALVPLARDERQTWPFVAVGILYLAMLSTHYFVFRAHAEHRNFYYDLLDILFGLQLAVGGVNAWRCGQRGRMAGLRWLGHRALRSAPVDSSKRETRP